MIIALVVRPTSSSCTVGRDHFRHVKMTSMSAHGRQAYTYDPYSQADLEVNQGYQGHHPQQRYQDQPEVKDSVVQPDQAPRYSSIINTPANQPQKKRFSLLTLVVAVLITAIVVGGALGGGLGASLTSCHNDRRYGWEGASPLHSRS